MAVFAYRGVNARGKTVKGVREADSQKALRGLLRRDGVMITELQEQSAAARSASKEIDLKRFFRRNRRGPLALVTRQLAVLLRSGIPAGEGLQVHLHARGSERQRAIALEGVTVQHQKGLPRWNFQYQRPASPRSNHSSLLPA